MATSTIHYFRGDTWLRSWVIKDAAVVDLTGGFGNCMSAHKKAPIMPTSSSWRLPWAMKLTITAGAGRVDLRVEAADMVVDPGTYRFELNDRR